MSPPFPEPTAPAADRSEVLVRYLDYFREVLLAKLDGLPDDALRTSRLPSGWAPIELAKHLTFVEMRWLEWGFEGRAVDDPWGDRRDDRWYVADDEPTDARPGRAAHARRPQRRHRRGARPGRDRAAGGAMGRCRAADAGADPAAPAAGVRPARGPPGRRTRTGRRGYRRVGCGLTTPARRLVRHLARLGSGCRRARRRVQRRGLRVPGVAGPSDRVLTIPNALSACSACSACRCSCGWSSNEYDGAAVLVLMVSGFTDYLDGKIARRWNQISRRRPAARPGRRPAVHPRHADRAHGPRHRAAVADRRCSSAATCCSR